MGIFNPNSDQQMSALDVLWMDELDHDGGGGGSSGGGGGGRGCVTATCVALGIILGLILALFTVF